MEKIIGKIIKEKLKAKKMSVIEFAEKLGTERSNVYHIFKRDTIDTSMLKRIGHILEYDFFLHFLEESTLKELQVSNNMKKVKVLLEVELDEDDIVKVGFKEKVFKVLKK